jgi:glycosyltransferase involved in cell wall biosynthesis
MLLSTIILTYNEEANLGACLASLKGLDCEIFVVDSGSTDRTVEIAKACGVKVVEHPFENYGVQRNWAQQNLPIQGLWVLHLDADEQLTPELANEINDVLKASPDGIVGYSFSRRVIFMGRWIRYGGHYPTYHLRLFRKDKGFCEDRLYDQHFVVRGKVIELRHDCLNFITPDLCAWTLRHTRWAELEAKQKWADRSNQRRVLPSLLGHAIQRRRWLKEHLYERAPPFVRAFVYWFYRYFIRLGFLDGKEGLIYHFLQGCWFRFLVDAKIYEARRKEGLKGEKSKRNRYDL